MICESVNEIIIGNDFTNFEEENLLQSIVSDFSKKNPETNIVFLNNKKRLGPFLNKYNTIKHCSNEIVYQIDSDNLPMKNFDSFVTKDILKKFNKENIYYPSKIYHFRNSSKFSLIGSKFRNNSKVIFSKKNTTFSKEQIQDYIKNNKKIDSNKSIRWLINIGNFIVYRNGFLESMEEGLDYDEKYLFAADQFMITFLWLKNKNFIELRKEHYHFHRKRNDSISFTEKERTGQSFNEIEEKIARLN